MKVSTWTKEARNYKFRRSDTEFDFVSSLMPDYIAPTLDGLKLILGNFGKEYPDAPRRDPKEFADGSLIERLKQERFVENLKQ